MPNRCELANQRELTRDSDKSRQVESPPPRRATPTVERREGVSKPITVVMHSVNSRAKPVVREEKEKKARQ